MLPERALLEKIITFTVSMSITKYPKLNQGKSNGSRDSAALYCKAFRHVIRNGVINPKNISETYRT